METSTINTVLQIISIAAIAVVGFWMKMIFNKLETRQSKEICRILHDQNDKDHSLIKTDINNLGAKLPRAH
jgi:ABC-type nickel/cobalt efflux system permease component RcnA